MDQELREKDKIILSLSESLEQHIKTQIKLTHYIDMLEDKIIQKDKLIEAILQSPMYENKALHIHKQTMDKLLDVKNDMPTNKTNKRMTLLKLSENKN